MPGINGADVILWTDDGGGGYTVLGGQRDVQLSETRSEIDTSSKDQPEEVTLPGRLVQEISLDYLQVPGEAQQADLKSKFRAGTQLAVELRYPDGVGGTVQERATCTILELSSAAPDQDASVFSTRLKVSGGWTTV